MKKLLVLALVAAFSGFAWMSLPGVDRMQTPGSPLQTASGSGMVLGIDPDRSVVTISHGPMPVLNMPAMTMGYFVKDKGQLATLQPMQKVEFRVSYDGSDYVITEIR